MARVEIDCREDGPNLALKDGKAVCALCRCGKSEKKPYCDGTHAKTGFRAQAAKILVSEVP